LYNEEFFNIPTNIADSLIFKSIGSFPKYILAALLIPSPLLPKS